MFGAQPSVYFLYDGGTYAASWPGGDLLTT